MKVNIYYGGRGIVDDPTLFVINKMQSVLEELNVTVTRYNLYEQKNAITTLPQTLKDVDGVLFATTVEWYGIGGYMQQFLDALWLYGDKTKIANIYMCPVVMSTTYGEREGKLNLATAWEILGGLPCSGLCGYIEDSTQLEMNEEYIQLIERKAENMYRTIHQKVASFPASNQAVKQKVSVSKNIDLTPQESEQLSKYVSNEEYVQQQKEDLQELASMFRGMMNRKDKENTTEYLADFEKAFTPQPGVNGIFILQIEGRKKPIVLEVKGVKLECKYSNLEKGDVEMQLSENTLESILKGKANFQRSFMAGEMKMKGDFKLFRSLDQIFSFS